MYIWNNDHWHSERFVTPASLEKSNMKKKWNQGELKWEDKLTKQNKKGYDICSSQKYVDKSDINHLAAMWGIIQRGYYKDLYNK